MHLTQVLRFWAKINLYKLISPLIKEIFFQGFVNKHYNYNFIDHSYKVISSIGEIIINNSKYAFDPCSEVLDKMNIYKLISPLIK